MENTEVAPVSSLPPQSPVPQYNDRPFRIIATLLVALFVTGYGGKDYFSMFLHPGFYLELAASVVFTGFLVWYISMAVRKLDERLPWRSGGLQRGLVQFFVAVLVPVILEFILAGLYFRAFGVDIMKTTFVAYALPLIIMLIVLFNCYYFAFYVLLMWKQAEHQLGGLAGGLRGQDQLVQAHFDIPFGTSGLSVPVNDILFFYRDDKFNYLQTARGDKHIINQTLDEVELSVSEGIFFRLNRQVIVNHSCCKAFQPAGFGKLKVEIVPPLPLPDMNIVSQRKAPKFKGWMEKTGNGKY